MSKLERNKQKELSNEKIKTLAGQRGNYVLKCHRKKKKINRCYIRFGSLDFLVFTLQMHRIYA